ncbi:hypothetical protein EDD16DRAFT_1524337 [Pisolithus croceorrhizus]|nr:hypothetical protein EDD16DRAFT_1524337 [Pisolithus croceorrhizus]
MYDWKQVYSEILSYVGRHKEARGNSQLRNEILQHEPKDSVALPQHLRVAIRMVFLPRLDPEDQDDEIAIMQHIVAVTRKNQEDGCDGEDAREEKAHPTKAGDYKKAFTPFTATQRIFKDETDAYDRERRDTKNPKTRGQRNRIIQQWWESAPDKRKAEARRAAEKWNKLGAPKGTHDLTMGSHVMMFVAHEAGEGQIKMAVFETAPGDGKKAFTESSEASKDWVLNGENILMDYLLMAPVEEDSAEKQEVEISLDEDGNPQMPTWAGQKLKVQQRLARAVFQAAYGTLEAEEKVIVSFISCQKEDAPLSWQFDRRPVGQSSKKREWMDPEDDSEEEVGGAVMQHSDAGPSRKMTDTGEVVNKGVPSTCGPGGGPARRGMWKGERGSPSPLGHMDLGCQVFAPGNSFGWGEFLEGPWAIVKYKVVLGLGLLLRECSHAQDVEEDDPLVSHLQFLLNSELGIRRAEDVMDIVGLIVSRLEQSSAGMKEPKKGGEGAVMGGGDREDEEKEEEEAPAVVPTQKRKRAKSGIVTRGKKVAKQDGEKGKKDGKRGRRMEEMG